MASFTDVLIFVIFISPKNVRVVKSRRVIGARSTQHACQIRNKEAYAALVEIPSGKNPPNASRLVQVVVLLNRILEVASSNHDWDAIVLRFSHDCFVSFPRYYLPTNLPFDASRFDLLITSLNKQEMNKQPLGWGPRPTFKIQWVGS
jgi:hypothetical protein